MFYMHVVRKLNEWCSVAALRGKGGGGLDAVEAGVCYQNITVN